MPLQPSRILIIDDDKDFIEATRMVLEPEGFEVLSATSGAAGLETARKEKPDVVLVDLLMEPADGFAVCERLRSLPETRRAAVLVVSGIGRKMHKHFASPEIGARLDADGYLEKPVEPKDLVKQVHEMVDLARSRTS